MILGRVKPLDAILATAEKKSLHRSLGAFQLTLFGIGCIIGTGIFVLTAAGAQKAGPGLMLSFVIAGAVCVVAALCYAEIAAMVPVAGSAYTYTYAVMGEFLAWTVGWALVLEYAIAASAVSVGWSGYFTGTIMDQTLGIHLPAYLRAGPLALGGAEGGFFNLPAFVIALLVTWLLMIGTTESARVNAVLVTIKLVALTVFVALTLPMVDQGNFNPFMPGGFFEAGGVGVGGAAATIFFAYVGFDAVSTAAEETKNPQRNVPIGLIGSLGICTIFYILVAAGAIGTIGGQPIMGADGIPLITGSPELARQCALPEHAQALVCSNEALAHVLRTIGYSQVGNWIGYAAFLALPSVILILLFGQTRIFFVMSRDGLLPEKLSTVHPKWKTPVYRHRHHRRRRRLRRRHAAGRPARRHRQCRHALRLLHGGGGGDDAAQARSRSPAQVPGAGAVAGRPADHGRHRRPLSAAAAPGDPRPAGLGGDRLRHLLRLFPRGEPSRPRPRRGPRARNPRHRATHSGHRRSADLIAAVQG